MAVSQEYVNALPTGSGWLSFTVTHHDYGLDVDTPLPLVDGSVVVDSAQAVRRTLSLNVAPSVAVGDLLVDVWDVLSAPVGEITVVAHWHFLDPAASVEDIPLGVFVVDTDQVTAGPGVIQVRANDRWAWVQLRRFRPDEMASVPSNGIGTEITRLVEGAFASGAISFPGWGDASGDSVSAVGSLLWEDGDRSKAVLDLGKAGGLQVGFDQDGLAFLRPTPSILDSNPPDWTVTHGAGGVLVAGDRARAHRDVRNAVVVSCSADGTTLPKVTVENTTAGDPYRVSNYGFTPQYYSSPLFTDTGQMTAAGKTILSKQLGLSSQLSFAMYPNYGMDADQIIEVTVPAADNSFAPVTELHIIDRAEFPLKIDPSGMNVATRSTRPVTDGS